MVAMRGINLLNHFLALLLLSGAGYLAVFETDVAFGERCQRKTVGKKMQKYSKKILTKMADTIFINTCSEIKL